MCRGRGSGPSCGRVGCLAPRDGGGRGNSGGAARPRRGQRDRARPTRLASSGQPAPRLCQSLGERNALHPGALEAGVLTEWRATLIVRESACLEVEDRQTLDAEMCADPDRLNGMGDARLAAAAKTIAYRLDPHAVVDRAARAETERTVSIRPAPDTMTYLTALLPVAQGVSVYAALRREADICADGRSRGQVMADTLVERVTGRSAATATPIAVNLVLSDETLMGGSSAPADVSGYGPIPAAVARGLISSAVGDERSRATLRRLYAHPTSGALMTMESRARLFPRGLATFIEFRDQRCRTPYCDAPIRHRDHARPWVAGGATSADNGLGLCERCNYVKETAGWFVESNVDEKCNSHSGIHYSDGCAISVGSTSVAGIDRPDGDQRNGDRRRGNVCTLARRIDSWWPAYSSTSTVLARTSWPGGRGSCSCSSESRKVRTSQSRVIANGNPRRLAGKCHRKQTATLAVVRVKRCGKSAPAFRVTGVARQTPPEARSRRPHYGAVAQVFEGCSPEPAGRPLEAPGDGVSRWMVAAALLGNAEQNPAYRPTRPP